jgi:hypothetical protein
MKSYPIERIADVLNIEHDKAKQARALVRHEYTKRELLGFDTDTPVFPSTASWARACYNQPCEQDLILHALNEVIGGYGVEVIEKSDSHGCGRRCDYVDYINTGDTYSATVLHDDGKFWIGTFGDYVEANGCKE